MPKHKDISSQFNSGASTEPEPEPAPESGSDVQQNEQEPPESRHLLLTRCRQGAMRSLKGLTRVSSTVVEQFTGPRQLHRRYWFWLGLGVGGGAIALGGGWLALEQSIPKSSADVLTFVRDDTITIKAADNTILQQIGPATNETLKIEEIPKLLTHAFLATEDRRFEKHHGVDYQGIFRAAVSNLMAGGVVEGGSTITQQLARIVYFDQERTVGRKLKEFRMAQKMEQELSKDKILERYLNLVYLGSGAYGIADAAWVYYSKTVNELTLPEMAMLAGLPSAPTEYSPFVNEKAAKQRRDIVLRRMQESGYITPAQAQEAIATPITTRRSNPKRLERKANYFTEYIQQELPKYVSKEVLAHKGLIVETTLNLDWQTAAEEAVKKTVEREGSYEGFKQAAMVAIDPRNGQIKAMVGGKDFYNQQFNRVTQAQRQPGSTFKTFLYTTAIAAGFSPYRGYLDAPYTIRGYTPNNYGDKFRGWINISDALTYSVNVVAVKTLIDVGWEPTIEIAKKMGIESPLIPTYSLALGASELNLLELTSAYGTLATKGVHTKAHGIQRIIDQRGKVIYEANFKGERAIDEDTASIMTWMLRNVVNDGTGRAAQLDDRPVAGKTGTSDEARDLWFIGYIPQMVTGVWLGNDDNKPTGGASSTAAQTWNRFMVKTVKNMEVEKFPERPSQLEGRKGIIQAQPIRGKRAISGNSDSSESDSRSRSRSNSDSSSSRSFSDSDSSSSSRRSYSDSSSSSRRSDSDSSSSSRRSDSDSSSSS
ncbi:MAG TPA: penicillin-binding protein, partial [Cyanobacteria bacterium UBA8553]|nr:penicillin-binding protein [Cyanobacteria bacterium UBA8553]